MKLATLKDGSRDGRLVVVSRDLTRCTDASFLSPTLQAALDDWQRISPHLAALAGSLEVGAVPEIRFHEHDAHSPLPRAYQHVGCGDAFAGPRDSIDAVGSIKVSAAVAVVTGDVARHAGKEDSRDAIALVMLAALASDQGEARTLAAFSPVAVTSDELGEGWDGRIEHALHISVNGKPAVAAIPSEDLVALVAAAAKARPLSAGAIVASSASEPPSKLQAGGTVRIEMKDAAGHSIFGAIEQAVQAMA